MCMSNKLNLIVTSFEGDPMLTLFQGTGDAFARANGNYVTNVNSPLMSQPLIIGFLTVDSKSKPRRNSEDRYVICCLFWSL